MKNMVYMGDSKISSRPRQRFQSAPHGVMHVPGVRAELRSPFGVTGGRACSAAGCQPVLASLPVDRRRNSESAKTPGDCRDGPGRERMKSAGEILETIFDFHVGRDMALSKSEKTFGTRDHPREFLTPSAAVEFCRESGHALWVRLPMHAGKFHIWPGGRKEFYPDRRTA